MRFHIEHTTEYAYPDPASESFSELRLRPRDSLRQKVTRHQTLIEPGVLVESHIDYFGNYVETISIPYRHQRLVISSACEVETKPFNDALVALDLSIAEARQMYQERRRELHDFMRPSQYVRLVDPVREMASDLLPEAAPFSESLLRLNDHLHRNLSYRPGATDAGTTVEQFLQRREGVCQDFAHLMLACLRSMGLSARYVSGYLLTQPPPGQPRLIGADASHAWVSVFCPQQGWVDFDPTNNIRPALEHITLAWGRDFADVSPLRGVILGGGSHDPEVQVTVLPIPAI